MMSPSELTHVFIDGGVLEQQSEATLFEALAANGELRGELRDLLSIRAAVHADVAAFTPPKEVTDRLFASLGIAPADAPASILPLWLRKVWLPLVAVVGLLAASGLTAIMLSRFNASSPNDSNSVLKNSGAMNSSSTTGALTANSSNVAPQNSGATISSSASPATSSNTLSSQQPSSSSSALIPPTHSTRSGSLAAQGAQGIVRGTVPKSSAHGRRHVASMVDVNDDPASLITTHHVLKKNAQAAHGAATVSSATSAEVSIASSSTPPAQSATAPNDHGVPSSPGFTATPETPAATASADDQQHSQSSAENKARAKQPAANAGGDSATATTAAPSAHANVGASAEIVGGVNDRRRDVIQPGAMKSIADYDYIALARGLVSQSNPASSIATSTTALPSNMALGIFYAIASHQLLGVEIGQEAFGQQFSAVIGDSSYQYKQNPTLLWGAVAYRAAITPLMFLGGVTPYVQADAGAARVGPLARASLGVTYLLGGRLDLLLGAEATMLWYQFQSAWFTTQKIGITVGAAFWF